MQNKISKKPKLLAPVGDWTMLTAAINSGADAVYFGIENLNMRSAAANFSLNDLPEVVKICKNHNVETNLALNTIIYENELDQVDQIVARSKEIGVDMVICWDLSVIQKCQEYDMPYCVSTQASVSNSDAARFYESAGASRIVLARECTIDKIKQIKQAVKIEIEAFIHGAMCVAISGRCFMSHDLFGKSANRGECIQPCRREYEIKDVDQEYSLILGKDYVMSPKDLCTIEFIDQLIEAGIDIFKIEGRKRSPEYIAKVVSVYRKAIDLYFENKLSEEIKKEFLEEMKKVYNRGFSPGFYFGTPDNESYAGIYGSVATTRKIYLGKVLNYYKKNKVVHVQIEAGILEKEDLIYIIGSSTGVVELKVSKIMEDENELDSAKKGRSVTFVCDERVRVNDKVYKVVSKPS